LPEPGAGSDFCRRAVAGGADLIQWGVDDRERPEYGDELENIRAVCREEGALLVVDGDPVLALAADVDGVHVSGADVPIGYARSVLGEGRLIGLSSRSADEAAMALDLEPDYLLHHEGTACSGVFAGLRAGRTVLYAAGIETLEQAATLVNAGVFRLAIGWNAQSGRDVQVEMAAYSKLLGRCL